MSFTSTIYISVTLAWATWQNWHSFNFLRNFVLLSMKTKKQFPPSFFFFFRKILAQVNIGVRWDCIFSMTRKILLLISLLSFVYFLSLSYNLCPRKSLLSTWLVPEGAVQNTKLLRLWQSRGMVRPLLPRLNNFRVERGQWGGVVWYSVRNFECSNSQDPGPAVFIIRIKSIKFLRRSIKCMNN